MGIVWAILFWLLFAYEVGKQIKRLLLNREDRHSLKRFKEYIDDWQLELVYTTRDGQKVYGYKNPMEMPAKRAFSAEIATKQASMNINREQLEGFLVAMETAGNAGQIVELFGYLHNLKERLTWACEEKTLENLANCYLVLEGENPDIVHPKWSERKKKIIKEDLEAKGFFLRYALLRTRDYSALSDKDILAYLETHKS